MVKNNSFSNRKKAMGIVATLAAMAALCIVPVSAATPAQDGTASGSGTVAGNVEIDGTIQAQTLDVTFPSVVTYTIDPQGTPTFTADTTAVTNNGTSKIDVTVASLASTTGGTLQFTDVEPSAHTDAEWAGLTLAQSKTDLALGVGITDATGWDTGYNTATDYAADKASVDFGHLASGSTGSFAFTAKHGLAFDQSYTAKHALTFEFSLV